MEREREFGFEFFPGIVSREGERGKFNGSGWGRWGFDKGEEVA